MNVEKKLLDLKSKIDASKEKLNELTGRESHLLEQLKEEFGCISINDAQKKLDEMQAEIDEFDAKIESGLEELEDKYDID